MRELNDAELDAVGAGLIMPANFPIKYLSREILGNPTYPLQASVTMGGLGKGGLAARFGWLVVAILG
jgi:hypothetical protein